MKNPVLQNCCPMVLPVRKCSQKRPSEIITEKIYAEKNETLSTFEICLYKENEQILNGLINASGRITCVQSNMLSNKSSTALKILNSLSTDSAFEKKFIIPQYIKDAIEWISK